MAPLKARVRDGRLVLDEPTAFPEGSEVALLPVDGWDDLDDDERRRLHEALAASEEDVALGRMRAAKDILADLRQQNR